MLKYDLPAAVPTLHNLKKTLDAFVSDSITLNSIEKIDAAAEFAQEAAEILRRYRNYSQVHNLEYQYHKLIRIASDIQHLNLTDNNELLEWLQDELETVFNKIKNTLFILEIQLN
ncbi:hypothetical protein [Flavobacterium hungaricum]|uniref:Four helix bundle protein n=1 Tax=Flavobacterium hungaricum TaxID=2082725 RepID=A0ABR9TH61_9FLAO|nr:hypothetical protein [Flavobacterium hungaricum]MBE8724600.1 hypothetical protein [Flavobacterium hungaricum]